MAEGVVLVGARAVGKSTIGPRLAASLALSYRDSDAEVEARSGSEVATLLREGQLRQWEERVLADLLGGGEPMVLSTGGGAVLWDGFANACEGWRVIWLDAAPDVLNARIAADRRDRPSLTGAHPDQESEAVASARRPLYERVAEKRFDTADATPRAIVRRILSFLGRQENAREGGPE